jgi:RNA polymerase sigma-54 factor
MQLNFSQQMKMSQQMKLAPRMIQSMEILQMPLMALNEKIEKEMEENEVLEHGNDEDLVPDSETAHELAESRDEANGSKLDEKELIVDSDHNNEADFERLLEMSQEWPDGNVTSATKPSSNRIQQQSDYKHDAMANMVCRPQSIHEHLLEQFRFYSCTPEAKLFGEYLIQNLDHNGRLQSTLPEIVQVSRISITQEEAKYTLSLIQKLDPIGVGARDYKECLLLQIGPDMPYRDVLITLITSHFEDLANNRLPIIQRKTGYSIETILAAKEELIHLNPYPGKDFEQRPAQRVTTDLYIDRDEKGKYIVKVEDEYVPQLRISKRYVEMLQSNPDATTKEYIKKKVESAKWLIESIEQRYSTLKRVAQAIVDFQTEFLENGPEHIVPLKMQQIADVVGVHVTTVSRAVDDKWIQTQRGLFPLKRFFGGGTTTEGGDEVAWGIIRLKLQEIVDAEDKSRPLSDEALAEALKKHGYKLARRTVTKYREALDIPSSRQRKVF